MVCPERCLAQAGYHPRLAPDPERALPGHDEPTDQRSLGWWPGSLPDIAVIFRRTSILRFSS
jgi:hypothetical protein